MQVPINTRTNGEYLTHSHIQLKVLNNLFCKTSCLNKWLW